MIIIDILKFNSVHKTNKYSALKYIYLNTNIKVFVVREDAPETEELVEAVKFVKKTGYKPLYEWVKENNEGKSRLVTVNDLSTKLPQSYFIAPGAELYIWLSNSWAIAEQ